MSRIGRTTAHGLRRAGLALAAVSAPALATDPQVQAQLDAMNARIQQQQQEIEQLKKLLVEKSAPVQAPQAVAAVPAAPAASVPLPSAPPPAPGKPPFEFYGYTQLDYIQDFKRVNQHWDATLRPSRIPTTRGASGADGQSVLSVRQTRFGVRTSNLVAGQELTTQFEFDLFGTGTNEGETTFHLRQAYGSWGSWLAGQTNSTFMDPDVFPNVIDYWGPPGMVFIRNPQIRWTKSFGADSLAVAIEQPGDDIDPGQIRELDPELAGRLAPREKYPDLALHYRMDRDWGHLQFGGLAREVGYQSLATPDNQPKGSEFGWGVNLSSNFKFGELDRLILGVVHGKGIASYMNDGGNDLAPGGMLPDPVAQVVSLTGLIAYLDHYWSDRLSSSVGYSQTRVRNAPLQEPGAFRLGQYASANLLYAPAKNLLTGMEVLWGQLGVKNGKTGTDSRVQFSVKYNFSSQP